MQGGQKAVRRLQNLSLRQRIDTEMRVYFLCPEIHNMERGRFGFCGIILTHWLICGNEQRQIDNFDTSA